MPVTPSAEKRTGPGKSAIAVFAAGLVVVVALAVLAVRGCGKGKGGEEPTSPAPPPTAAERTQAKINERMADTNYVAGLNLFAQRQADLARIGAEAARELGQLRGALAATNEAARAVFEELDRLAADEAAQTNGAYAAQLEKADALVRADPLGRRLLAKRDAIAKAHRDNQNMIADFIAARTRKQAEAGMAAELEDARRFRDARIAKGDLKAPPPRTPPTNRIERLPPPSSHQPPTNGVRRVAAPPPGARRPLPPRRSVAAAPAPPAAPQPAPAKNTP